MIFNRLFNPLFLLRIKAIKDIIFSEILADPTPKAGLPETEFVELFNRSEFAFDLSGWKITDRGL